MISRIESFRRKLTGPIGETETINPMTDGENNVGVGADIIDAPSEIYRVTFNGNLFEVALGTIPMCYEVCDIENSYSNLNIAKRAVQILNAKLSNSIEDMEFSLENGIPSLVVERCKECGRYFVIDEQDLEFFRKKNLAIPKRCKACRKMRKKARGV